MALDISGSTIGYDLDNLKACLERIKTDVINDCIEKMETGESDLETWVDNAWHGESAEQFKENFENHQDKIEDMLKKSYEAIESVFLQIAEEIAREDENLIQEED